MDKVINRVRETIEKYHMLQTGDSVIVGVSGGPDSICLLHVMNSLKDEYGIKLFAAHLNHRLRGQAADADEAYVIEICKQFNVPCYVKTVDIKQLAHMKGISEEVAGREERYRYFFELMQKLNARKIAIAHNINDQAETVLMRLIRGSGLEGLAGIKPVRTEGIIRPLLYVKREWIEEYCDIYRLNPCIDETNKQPIYTRNITRHILIPHIIDEYNPNFINIASQTADILREDSDYIEQNVDMIAQQHFEVYTDKVGINTEFLLAQHPAIQRRLVRKAVEIIKSDINSLGYKHVEALLKMLAKKRTGLVMDLPGMIRAETVYNKIYIYKCRNEKVEQFCYPLYIDKSQFIKELDAYISLSVVNIQDINEQELNLFTKAFDYNKIKGKIFIRNRLPGDRFMPLGMQGTRKLKDFLIDLKVPRWERDYIPLITTTDNIIWVVGYRVSEYYKCDNNTCKALIIKFEGVKRNEV